MTDGHDPAAIEDTLRRRHDLGVGKPLFVVARTIIAATVVDAYAPPMGHRAGAGAGGPGRRHPGREDNRVGRLGSELAEAAAAVDEGPRVHGLAVCSLPKSGRTPDDVLAYVRLAVGDIVAAAGLARSPNRAGGRAGQQPDSKEDR